MWNAPTGLFEAVILSDLDSSLDVLPPRRTLKPPCPATSRGEVKPRNSVLLQVCCPEYATAAGEFNQLI